MRSRTIRLAGISAAIIAVACSSDKAAAPASTSTPATSKIVNFRATMNGANEFPANTSTGSGAFTATLDTETSVFTYDFTFTGLSAGVSNGHIHGPAFATGNAGTTINFNTLPGATFSFGATSGTGRGTVTLAATTQITAAINGDSLKKLLLDGMTYVNIHTTAIPGGEIRGQITKQP